MTTFVKKWIWSSFGQVNVLCIYFFKAGEDHFIF
ncbi:hypothetical protein CGSSa00_05833 [Staphylococcus aureus subsp. aureus CGS00]|nr:hypothetical protein CGSSa00_05833 [Staphylococcus aureus subsp. aureus CGS00]QGQ74551.1 hypothetical protein SAST44_03449 [Staphylococcus aureus]QGQ77954.1 hypothetical protein SAST45_04426 [Staphylococcus aureus]